MSKTKLKPGDIVLIHYYDHFGAIEENITHQLNVAVGFYKGRVGTKPVYLRLAASFEDGFEWPYTCILENDICKIEVLKRVGK